MASSIYRGDWRHRTYRILEAFSVYIRKDILKSMYGGIEIISRLSKKKLQDRYFYIYL